MAVYPQNGLHCSPTPEAVWQLQLFCVSMLNQIIWPAVQTAELHKPVKNDEDAEEAAEVYVNDLNTDEE